MQGVTPRKGGDFLSRGCAGIEGAMVMTGRINSGLLRFG